jgi:hypothetical protein
MFLVKWDAMFFDEFDEIVRRESSQRRTAKVWVVGQEVLGAAAKIREVTAAATRNQNLFARLIGALKDRDAGAKPACFGRAQKSGSTGA